jgi:UDP-4-amino-4,6-dideoxy-N-acetyl-beta-L-altrosamine N-acetyltransferase
MTLEPILARYTLRPLAEGDLATVLAWRNDPRVHANMYSSHTIAPEEHAAWFARNKDRKDAEFLVVAFDGRPFAHLYIDPVVTQHKRANWGFYIGDVDAAPAKSGSVIEYMAIERMFGRWGVEKICGEVLDFNAPVVNMHEGFGFVREGTLARHILKDGRWHDVVLVALFRDVWEGHKAAKAADLARKFKERNPCL